MYLNDLLLRMLQSRTKDRIGVTEALSHDFLQHELGKYFSSLDSVNACINSYI